MSILLIRRTPFTDRLENLVVVQAITQRGSAYVECLKILNTKGQIASDGPFIVKREM